MPTWNVLCKISCSLQNTFNICKVVVLYLGSLLIHVLSIRLYRKVRPRSDYIFSERIQPHNTSFKKAMWHQTIGTRETESYHCAKLRHPASNYEYCSSTEKFKLLAATGSAPTKLVCIRYKLSRNGDNSPTVLVL